MYKYTSVDFFTLCGYLMQPSYSPMNHRAIDWRLPLGYQCKSVAILYSKYYED